MHTIPELDRQGLRKFAITTGIVLALIFGLLIPWLFDHAYPYWPWAILAVLTIWGLAAPVTLRPVYKGWMTFALILGKVTTPIVLGIAFFLVFLPVALVFRLLGKDPMQRKFDRGRTSYRVTSDKIDRQNFEKPF